MNIGGFVKVLEVEPVDVLADLAAEQEQNQQPASTTGAADTGVVPAVKA